MRRDPPPTKVMVAPLDCDQNWHPQNYSQIGVTNLRAKEWMGLCSSSTSLQVQWQQNNEAVPLQHLYKNNDSNSSKDWDECHQVKDVNEEIIYHQRSIFQLRSPSFPEEGSAMSTPISFCICNIFSVPIQIVIFRKFRKSYTHRRVNFEEYCFTDH